MAALAEMLPKVPCLESLNLGKNGIGDRGSEALGEVLVRLEHLKFLNLAENKIGDDGARSLAMGVARCRHLPLKKLNVSANMVTVHGQKLLQDNWNFCKKVPNNLIL